MKARAKRRLLLAAGGAGALAALAAAGWRLWPQHGFVNPCRSELPLALARHEAVREAWAGLDPSQVWDCHVHLAGTGDSGAIRLNPDFSRATSPLLLARRLFLLNAACVGNAPGRVDETYVRRLRELAAGMRPGFKLMLLAFDRVYTERGEPADDDTALYVPNEYTAAVARSAPEVFEWVASIHPYRPDCVPALHAARSTGARAVKWLPAAMGIDPASPRCDRFYEAAAKLDLPLLTHAGTERTLPAHGRQHLGNPLRLRRALEHGVRVVVAHCATLGEDRDLDRGPNGPYVASFALFERLMDEARYERLLFGDLSAVALVHRAGPALVRLIERTDWHPRLLNGSDYPLPGVMPLVSTQLLEQLGVLDPRLAPVLAAIREHNPLLFDFVLKRHLRAGARRFSPRVFETRPFFVR
jgi:mannonate dehydratase